MPGLGTVLKNEIARISRREARRETEPAKKAATAHRRHIATLRRQLRALEQKLASLSRKAGKASPTSTSSATGEEAASHRFVAKGLRTLRSRLGLSASDFGRLVGVSGQTIYNWETKKAAPRKSQLAALAKVRAMGKREAQTELEQMNAVPAKKGGARKRRAASSQ